MFSKLQKSIDKTITELDELNEAMGKLKLETNIKLPCTNCTHEKVCKHKDKIGGKLRLADSLDVEYPFAIEIKCKQYEANRTIVCGNGIRI